MQTWTRFLAQRKSRTRRCRAQKERVGTQRIGVVMKLSRPSQHRLVRGAETGHFGAVVLSAQRWQGERAGSIE